MLGGKSHHCLHTQGMNVDDDFDLNVYLAPVGYTGAGPISFVRGSKIYFFSIFFAEVIIF